MPDHDTQTLRLVQAQGGFDEPGAFAEEVARLAESEDVPREVREALLLRPGGDVHRRGHVEKTDALFQKAGSPRRCGLCRGGRGRARTADPLLVRQVL